MQIAADFLFESVFETVLSNLKVRAVSPTKFIALQSLQSAISSARIFLSEEPFLEEKLQYGTGLDETINICLHLYFSLLKYAHDVINISVINISVGVFEKFYWPYC